MRHHDFTLFYMQILNPTLKLKPLLAIGHSNRGTPTRLVRQSNKNNLLNRVCHFDIHSLVVPVSNTGYHQANFHFRFKGGTLHPTNTAGQHCCRTSEERQTADTTFELIVFCFHSMFHRDPMVDVDNGGLPPRTMWEV